MKNNKRNNVTSILAKAIIGMAIIYSLYFVINSVILINDSKSYTKYSSNLIYNLSTDTVLSSLLPNDTNNIELFKLEELKGGEKILKYKINNEEHLILKLPLTVSKIKWVEGKPSNLQGFFHVFNFVSGVQLNYKYKKIDELKDISTILHVISDGNISESINLMSFYNANFINFEFNDITTLNMEIKRPNIKVTCKYYFSPDEFIIEFIIK